MSAIFPKWTNRLPGLLTIGSLLVSSGVVAGFWYYFTPKYTRVGYQPIQPVSFSHALHVGQVGLDCRYCHNGEDKSWYSNIPAASTCMNCHVQVLKDDPRLAPVRESASSGRPIPWIQVHRLPDFVFFNHAVHVNRGISCVECHGQVNQMDEVYHAKPLTMAFCLECHRHPATALRPLDKVTDLNWKWNDDSLIAAEKQRVNGERFAREWRVQSLQTCSACHR